MSYTVIFKKAFTALSPSGTEITKIVWKDYGVYPSLEEAQAVCRKLNDNKGKANYNALIYRTSTLKEEGYPVTSDMSNNA